MWQKAPGCSTTARGKKRQSAQVRGRRHAVTSRATSERTLSRRRSFGLERPRQVGHRKEGVDGVDLLDALEALLAEVELLARDAWRGSGWQRSSQRCEQNGSGGEKGRTFEAVARDVAGADRAGVLAVVLCKRASKIRSATRASTMQARRAPTHRRPSSLHARRRARRSRGTRARCPRPGRQSPTRQPRSGA